MASPFAALAARLAISAEGALKRNLTLDRSVAIARSIWPQARVAPVGSFANGTSLHGSDIDLVVDTRGIYSRAGAGIWAQKMEDELIKNRITKPTTTAVHASARVPIVTYIDSKYLIGVDISFTTNGLTNTEYVRRELDERPYMRTMIILLKYWLKSRRYNKVYTGGLSSYGLALTVIGYFNVRKTVKARNCTVEDYHRWIEERDYQRLLVDYLAFWSCQWKLASTMLEPAEGAIYKKGTKGHCGKARNSLLCIADPTDPTNDVTNGTYKIFKLREAMKVLRNKLETVQQDVELDALENIFKKTGREWPEDDQSRQKFKGKSGKAKSKQIKMRKIRKPGMVGTAIRRVTFSAD
ncbi:uncharacterized protein H6S33_005855 [Morchella sextelata]|uniref:uncharacterized protein n=1 Tax=Morchella sextelata TaxID=1174677 RepID=UPI001D050528|nr:uncharacterized protein H6S33_005855 [Morchella sextelata]KAH0613969.1 hypothetical protein H6S33_005855 [Morchella sextelata]